MMTEIPDTGSSQTVRIVHVIMSLTTGGAELMLKRLITAHLQNPLISHQVISLQGLGTVGPQLQALGVQVEIVGMRSALGIPRAIWRMTSKIRTAKPDIVQTWMYHADLLGGVSSWLAGVRRIAWNVRATDITPEMGVARATFWIRRVCALLSKAVPQRIVYVGEAARAVHERLGYDPGKSIVIHNGYEVPAEIEDPSLAPLRRELGVPAGAILIGTAGRFVPEKDYPGFVSAASLVARQYPVVRFVMIGLGLEWGNEELARWVKEAGLQDRFHLLGERKDFARCLAALDVYSLQSFLEGFPNVVAEAMAIGVPCVVTDVGEAALIVGDTGLVVPPGRPDLLANALSKMVEAGREVRAELGERARSRIADNFSIGIIGKRYEDLYGSLREGRACS